MLHDERVINPRGGESEYGRIHFKHVAMGIIPLDNDLNTYLVDQWSYPLNAYSWEIPMGGGHLDEDSLGSAKRELCRGNWDYGCLLGKVVKSTSIELGI